LCNVDSADTTVILLGDNGNRSPGHVAAFDPLHSKGSLYEDGVRVPFDHSARPCKRRRPSGRPARHSCRRRLTSTPPVARIAKVAPQLATTEDAVSMVP
jgi:hypothetical protein